MIETYRSYLPSGAGYCTPFACSIGSAFQLRVLQIREMESSSTCPLSRLVRHTLPRRKRTN